MLLLVIGLVIFFATHSIAIVAPAWRERLVAQFGERPWKGWYAVLSLVGFLLLIKGYGSARLEPVVLYSPPVWLKQVGLLLMLPVFPLLLSVYLPGRIKTAAKHPMLAAVKFWALAHLLTNGALADVLLFGAFLIWAAADRVSLKRRGRQVAPAAPPGKFNDAIALLGGLAIYALFIVWAHRWLFGVPPIALA